MDKQEKPEDIPIIPGELDGEDDDGRLVHSDVVTPGEDPAKVASAKRRMYMLAVLALVFAVAGGAVVSMFSGEEPQRVIAPEQTSTAAKLPLGETFYINQATSSGSLFYTANYASLELEPAIEKNAVLNPSRTSFTTNQPYQVSTDGRITAYESAQSGTIMLMVGSDSSSDTMIDSPSGILDWLLTPDGESIFYLAGDGSLGRYVVQTQETTVATESFMDVNQKQTRLFHTKDRAVATYSIGAENVVTEFLYNYGSNEHSISQPRSISTSDQVVLNINSLSPDGSSLIVTQTSNDREVLRLLSLNSLTLRTVFQVDENQSIDTITWSPDSTKVALLLRNTDVNQIEKVTVVSFGTLAEEDVLVGEDAAGVSDLQWSPLLSAISYRQAASYKSVDVNDLTINTLVEDVDAAAAVYSGWFSVE